MKTRNGFVSNSSASSFVVKHIDRRWPLGEPYPDNHKGALSKKEIASLEKFGFKAMGHTHPSHLDSTGYMDPEMDGDGKILVQNYCLSVACNEWDVIQFLVKNDIGFIANGHYGHVTYLFHKGNKNLMVFNNYGSTVETYYQDSNWKVIDRAFSTPKQKAYYQISIKKVLKGD